MFIAVYPYIESIIEKDGLLVFDTEDLTVQYVSKAELLNLPSGIKVYNAGYNYWDRWFVVNKDFLEVLEVYEGTGSVQYDGETLYIDGRKPIRIQYKNDMLYIEGKYCIPYTGSQIFYFFLWRDYIVFRGCATKSRIRYFTVFISPDGVVDKYASFNSELSSVSPSMANNKAIATQIELTTRGI